MTVKKVKKFMRALILFWAPGKLPLVPSIAGPVREWKESLDIRLNRQSIVDK